MNDCSSDTCLYGNPIFFYWGSIKFYLTFYLFLFSSANIPTNISVANNCPHLHNVVEYYVSKYHKNQIMFMIISSQFVE